MTDFWTIALTSVVTALGTWGVPQLLKYLGDKDTRTRQGRADTIEEWRKLYADTRAELVRVRTECEARERDLERRWEQEVRARRRLQLACVRHGIELPPPNADDPDAEPPAGGGVLK